MFDFLGNVLKNVVSKPATRMYPYEKRPPMKDTRGSLGEININTCIFCSICEKKCPSNAITVNKTERSWELNRLKCVICNICVEVCPKDCLKMDEAHLPGLFSRERVKRVGPPKPAAPAKPAE